ncbi:MAG TPA: hypothetical protein PLD27_08980 [bacterium]|nr:hypothetical protein [bacterium]HOL48675.1 hypothetical protein [bacterium]HPQ19420.1 hypothetical protein [bacterium]
MEKALINDPIKNFLKIKNLVEKQEDIINSLLKKHYSIIDEKDKIIENQYNIIKEQSKNIEQLLLKLEEKNNRKNIFNKIKTLFKLKEPILNN